MTSRDWRERLRARPTAVVALASVNLAVLATVVACGVGAVDQSSIVDPTASHHGTTPGSPAKPSTAASATRAATPPPGPDLADPEVIDSRDGVLATELTAAVSPVSVGGRDVRTLVYNGKYPGPTLRMRPGDDLRVALQNNSDGDTNLHTHGMNVSPEGFADNVLHHLEPGGRWDVAIDTRADLNPGLYWYHAHNHGDTEPQVTGGLAGALMVRGGLDEVPGVAGRTDRTLLVQASQFSPDGAMVPVEKQTTDSVSRFVNGQLNPVIRMRPGDIQRWRIANLQANDFMRLSLDGHRLHQIAADSNAFDEVVATDSLVMAPANRAELLIEAGEPGSYLLRAGSFAGSADAVLATVVVEGDPVTVAPLPTTLLPREDLRDEPVQAKRTVTFSNHQDTGWAVIDGKPFDHSTISQTVVAGELEEWTVRNDSDFWHPFHIHINDFQVTAIGDKPYDAHSLADTVPLPPNSSVTFRIRFTNYTGKAVYHCHILNHEDLGMMAAFEVVPAKR